MNPLEAFADEVKQRVDSYQDELELKGLAHSWVEKSMSKKYVYNYSWLGVPIIQYPEDILAMQEIIWRVKPDLIIETGIAHGGSIIFSASMLELLGGDRQVLGIDIDIREHNKRNIEQHPMFKRLVLIEGSSVDENIYEQVVKIASKKEKILVFLDSNHTHDHVLKELKLYAPLVSLGSYCVVFDTFIEDMPKNFFVDRPWDVGNNPKTAVREYLESNSDFELDKDIQNKLLITVAPDGYLKRVK